MKKTLIILLLLSFVIATFVECSKDANSVTNIPQPDPAPSPLNPTDPPKTLEVKFTPFASMRSVNVEAVRVGEYYWTNKNFSFDHPTAMKSTKDQIDRIHKMYVMFENWDPFGNKTPETADPSYWSYFQDKTQDEVLNEFEKVYGSYYKLRPAISEGICNGTMSEAGKAEGKLWGLPSEKDILQLLGMCGNATTPEIRQYLSYGAEDANAPSVAQFYKLPYHWWFYFHPAQFRNPIYMNGVSGETNGYDPANTNKYKLNFVPAGSKFEHNTTLTTNNYEVRKTFNVVPGDFNGLNQVLRIASRTSVFDLHDFPEMKYTLLIESFPARFCRPLTDQELGYKLYISVNGKPLNEPVQYDIGDWSNTPRFRTGEEQLLAEIRNHTVDPSSVEIIKLPLSETPPSGFEELPRGYIRGFYVQYIIDQKTPTKTVADIIRIAAVNPFLWVKR